MAKVIPTWAHFEHDRLRLAPVPERRDVGMTALLTVVFAIYTVAVATGMATDGATFTVACMAVPIPVLVGVAVMMALDLVTRRELHLTPDGVQLVTRRFGKATRQQLALHGASVERSTQEGSKGWTHTAVIVHDASGSRLHFTLPGGQNLRERGRAYAELEWLVGLIEAVIDAAPEPSEVDDRQARARLAAVLRRASER